MARPILYLNTDLDLVSRDRPTDLVAGWRAGGAYTLHRPIRGGDGLWHVTLETGTECDEPDKAIAALLDTIEGLSVSRRRAWLGCVLREFNIGYNSGFEPWAFNNGISNGTLRRLARARATLRITIYPPDEQDEGQGQIVRAVRKVRKKRRKGNGS